MVNGMRLSGKALTDGWHALREGMAMAEVVALVGEPEFVEEDHGLMFWGYATDRSWHPPRIIFDRNGTLDSWISPV